MCSYIVPTTNTEKITLVCPDYDADCNDLDHYACYWDIYNKFEGGQAQGLCPFLHSDIILKFKETGGTNVQPNKNV